MAMFTTGVILALGAILIVAVPAVPAVLLWASGFMIGAAGVLIKRSAPEVNGHIKDKINGARGQ